MVEMLYTKHIVQCGVIMEQLAKTLLFLLPQKWANKKAIYTSKTLPI